MTHHQNPEPETTPLALLGPLVARRRVARCFRGMRVQAGLSLDEAASKLDVKRSGLHRLESGETAPHVHIARSMMDLYDQYMPDLLDTIRVSRQRGWWREYRVSNRDYVGWESGASGLLEVAVVRIPDLLQTEDYTRTLFVGQEQLADEISTRRIRQQRLTRLDYPLEARIVLDESALRNRLGSSDVMRDQLMHVTAVAECPNVHIRLLPADTGGNVRTSGFRLLGFHDHEDPPVLYADCAQATVREDRQEHVTEARRAFDAIEAVALSEEDSVTLIKRMARELYSSEQAQTDRKTA